MQEALGAEVIPRSVLFAEFEGVAYLLCALGDGHLFNWYVSAQVCLLLSSRCLLVCACSTFSYGLGAMHKLEPALHCKAILSSECMISHLPSLMSCCFPSYACQACYQHHMHSVSQLQWLHLHMSVR